MTESIAEINAEIDLWRREAAERSAHARTLPEGSKERARAEDSALTAHALMVEYQKLLAKK